MKYFLRSLLTFLLLFSLVALVADRIYFQHGLSVSLSMQIALAILLLQYLVSPYLIRWLMDIDWNAGLPARNQQFLEELCAREGLPVPQVGIIHGSMPNAFTFGRMQADASIVVTTGLLEALTPEEANAVIAHEAGHIKHWDFLAITAAAAAPLLLYQLYAMARRFKDDHWATWIAYGAYWVSELMVLSLSRTREFWADQFSAKATGDPSLLASGLVKICYGMAKVEREGEWAKKYGDPEQKQAAAAKAHLGRKIGVLGISSAEAAFALTGPSPEGSAAIMRWDLENPWARVYQFCSTHPLTALRVKALNRLAALQGLPAACPLPANTRIQWRRFPLELALWAAPWVIGTAMLAVTGLERARAAEPSAGGGDTLAVLAVALAAAWIGRIAYRYQGRFKAASIRELALDTTPSDMRPRAVTIECEVLGRGEAEAWWSPDLVVKDDTGILFMLDRQSIPLARYVLAQEVDRFIGRRVTLHGWYRRGPMPYVELSRLEASGEPLHSSYSRWIQMGYAAAGSAILYFVARSF